MSSLQGVARTCAAMCYGVLWRAVLCRKREYKIKNLEAETNKITAKERQEGGLTQGQASTLVSEAQGARQGTFNVLSPS